MTSIIDHTIEIAVRRARMDAACGHGEIIAAMEAGSGAELVARAQLAREVLETRRNGGRRHIDKAGAGFAPVPASPNSDAPAASPAGVSINRPVGPLRSGQSTTIDPGA